MSDEDTPNDEVILDLRARIEAAPHDPGLRFELGSALFRRGEFRAAIPELQLAQQDHARRLEAMRLLANAFEAIGMHDLAASRSLMLDALSKTKKNAAGLAPRWSECASPSAQPPKLHVPMKFGDLKLWRSPVICWAFFTLFLLITFVVQVASVRPYPNYYRDWLLMTALFGTLAGLSLVLAVRSMRKKR